MNGFSCSLQNRFDKQLILNKLEQTATELEGLVRSSEESGATITSIEQEFGKVMEYSKPIEQGYEVFKMTSFYYICNVNPLLGEQSLDQYEKELGFKAVWVDVDDAIRVNQSLMNYGYKEIPIRIEGE